MITQETMEKYFALNSTRKELESQARKIKTESDKIKRIIEVELKKSKKKQKFEEGRFNSYYKVGSVRPAWKELYIDELGEEAAQTVIDNTVPSKSLVVDVDEEWEG